MSFRDRKRGCSEYYFNYVFGHLVLESCEEPYLIDEIQQYMKEADKRKRLCDPRIRKNL